MVLDYRMHLQTFFCQSLADGASIAALSRRRLRTREIQSIRGRASGRMMYQRTISLLWVVDLWDSNAWRGAFLSAADVLLMSVRADRGSNNRPFQKHLAAETLCMSSGIFVDAGCDVHTVNSIRTCGVV